MIHPNCCAPLMAYRFGSASSKFSYASARQIIGYACVCVVSVVEGEAWEIKNKPHPYNPNPPHIRTLQLACFFTVMNARRCLISAP